MTDNLIILLYVFAGRAVDIISRDTRRGDKVIAPCQTWNTWHYTLLLITYQLIAVLCYRVSFNKLFAVTI